MKKKRTNKIISPLLFVKRLDKNGNNYYLDTKSGKKVKGDYYKAQFSSFGRVSKETTSRLIELIDSKKIKSKEIRENANDFFKIDYNLKNEIKRNNLKSISGQRTEFYFNAGKVLEEAEKSEFNIMIKGVDDFRFRKLDNLKVQEQYEKFIDLSNQIIDDLMIEKGSEKVGSDELVTFKFLVDLNTDTYYIDFSTISKISDDTVIKDLLD